MIRLANSEDAQGLHKLNELFNGTGLTTIDIIKDSLLRNKQEIVVVKEEEHQLVGFLCAQIKRSFCYHKPSAELTELYVRPEYRKRGYARAMIEFIEDYVFTHYNISKFELLTGIDNEVPQTVYEKLGYQKDDEIYLRKTKK